MITVGFHTLKTQYLSHPDFYQEYKLYYNIHGPLIENSGTRGDFFILDGFGATMSCMQS